MNLRTTILSGLAVFFLIMWLTKGCNPPTTPPEDTELWREKVAQREGVIKTKDSIIASLQAARTIQRVAYQKDSSRLVRENTRLSRGYQKAKDEVQHLRDSLPEVDRFAHAADSLLSAKDSLYVSEVNHRIALEQLHSFEMAAMAKKNILQVEISEEYRNRAEISERKLARSEKRLERKKVWNTIWKSTTAAFVAVTTVLILTE